MLQEPVGTSDVWDFDREGGPAVIFCTPTLAPSDSELLAEALAFYLDHLAVKDSLRQPILSLMYHLARCSGHFANKLGELGKGMGRGT